MLFIMDNAQHEHLIGAQRSEFSKAAKLQSIILRAQIAIAGLAAVTVFATSDLATYAAALLTVVTALLWAWLSWRYREVRSLAERARRATLVTGGLGSPMSPDEYRDLMIRLSSSSRETSVLADAGYFAANSSQGYARLAEMLEESAFYSSHLLRWSSERTWKIFGAFVTVSLLLLFTALPFVGSQQWLGGVRVVCSMLILLISADVLGAALSYSSAAQTVLQVVLRLQRAKVASYPLHDILLILGDYNSAVEAAPMFTPGIFEAHQDELNKLWAQR